MVQASQEQRDNKANALNVPALPDPALIRAARNIYRIYYDSHPKIVQRPLGVAISRVTYRGKLIFNNRPALLPQEYFVPFNEIESELY